MNRAGWLASQAVEFLRYALGRDYFRQPQPLGAHFSDPRCYYNDLRGKTAWPGPYVDGVPALEIVGPEGPRFSPCMVLLYGLGSMDRFLLQDGSEAACEAAVSVLRWLDARQTAEGYWPETISETTRHEYYSANSAMNQGLALSFLLRVARFVQIGGAREVALRVLRQVRANILKPPVDGGTALVRKSDLFFLEYCRRDETVVFNGWVYAVFGLFDYVAAFPEDEEARAALVRTLSTLERVTPDYQLPNGWARYDDRGRLCSPFYHRLHISLLDALFRLTRAMVFSVGTASAIAADSKAMRVYYTLRKMGEKFNEVPAR
jgi:heparosan-N-sulfate-glucuronate 5-epimerase